MSVAKWLQINTKSLSGKTIAVSGATGGIGKELCMYLGSLGADLILLDRNQTKSEHLQKKLSHNYPTIKIKRITMDLEDIDTVKNAANCLLQYPLDVLILNAGAYHIPRHTCSTGVENIFQINFLSPYFLAKTLKKHLEQRDGKLIAVGSIAHNYSKTDPKDIDFSTRTKHSLAYGNAKRYLIFALHGLYNGSAGLAITHPGITFTNITAHYPKLIFAIIKHPMKIIFMKPHIACLSILHGVFSDCKKNEWIGPRYFDIWGLPKKKRLKTCQSDEAENIFQIAEALVKNL